MKSSLIRSFVIFTAGASTAVLASGMYREAMTPEKYTERLAAVLAEIEVLGSYVAVVKDGRIGIYTGSDEHCISPKPPQPNDPVPLPPNAVDILKFDLGIMALEAGQKRFLMSDKAPVFEYAACKPVDEFKG